MSHMGVVGAGTMGNGIAHVFAQHGWSVTLIDVSEAALKQGVAAITVDGKLVDYAMFQRAKRVLALANLDQR